MASVLNFGEIAEDESIDMAHRVEGIGDYSGQYGYLLALMPYDSAKVLWDESEGAEQVPQNAFRIA